MKLYCLFLLLFCFVEISISQNISINGTSVTITNHPKGALAICLNSSQLGSVQSLTISGDINAQDFRTIRDLMPVLEHVDLKACTISPYSGTEGTYYNTSANYSANTIPYGSFGGKSLLKTVVLPENCTYIDGTAFEHSGITSLSVPSTVTGIGIQCFNYCENLETISFESPEKSKMLSISANCFLGSGLKRFDTPPSVRFFQSSAFENCSKLEIVTINGPVESFEDEFVFANCPIKKFIINVSDASSVAYTNMFTKGVISPDAVLRVPVGTYNNWSTTSRWFDNNYFYLLEGVVLPEIINTQAASVFSNSADINYQAKTIGDGEIFEYGILYDTNPHPTLNSQKLILGERGQAKNGDVHASLTNLTPNTTYYARAYYVNASNTYGIEPDYGEEISFKTSNTKATVNGTNISISGAVAGCLTSSVLTAQQKSGVKSLIISGEIDYRDFRVIRDEMPALTYVNISGCKVVAYTENDVLYPENTVPALAFYQRSGIGTITLPATITAYGDRCFYGCSLLNSLPISNATVSIAQEAFAGCTSTYGIILPASLKYIGSGAFQNCTRVTSIFSYSSTPADLSSSPGVFSNLSAGCVLRVPGGSFNTYKQAEGWNQISALVDGVYSTSFNMSSITSVTGVSATLNAYMFGAGDANPIDFGFVYGTNPSPTLENSSRTAVSQPQSAGPYSAQINGLPVNTTFYVRAYSRTQGTDLTKSTLYSSEVTFTTLANGCSINGTEATIAGATGGILTGPVLLSATDKLNITSIKISGTLDARDFKVMRDLMPALTSIDLLNTTISEYSGGDGPSSTDTVFYPAGEIPVKAFQNNSRLTSFVAPSSAKSLGISAFESCTALKNIQFSNGIEIVPDNAFKSCTELSSVTLPGTLTAINSYAFQNCIKLSEIILPPTLKSLGFQSFSNCTLLNNLVLPSSLESISFLCFAYCTSLTSLDIPASVTTLAQQAFQSCTNLTTVKLPDTMTTLELGLFMGCSKLVNVTIPAAVTRINTSVFNGCKELNTITIPSGVTNIGTSCFKDCSGLRIINCKAVSPPQMYSSSLSNVPLTSLLLKIPGGSLSVYKSASYWNGIATIKEGFNAPVIKTLDVSSISSTGTVLNASLLGLGDVTPSQLGFVWNTNGLPTTTSDHVANLGIPSQTGPFSTSLTGLAPNTTYYLRSYAVVPASPAEAGVLYGEVISFTTGSSSTVTINGTQATLTNAVAGCIEGGNALTFEQKSSITSLTISGTIDARDIRIIRDEMPYLSHLDLSAATIVEYTGDKGTNSGIVTTYNADILPEYAFKSNTSIAACTLPLTAKGVGKSSFESSVIESITLQNTVSEIMADAFAYCSKLKQVIMTNVNSIDSRAFYQCISLQNIAFPGSLKTIGQEAFAGSGLTIINLNEGLESVFESAFSNCSQATDIYIPSTLKTLGNNVFSECITLKSITVAQVQPMDLSSSPGAFNLLNVNEVLLRVPTNIPGYNQAQVWHQFLNVVEGILPPVLTILSASETENGIAVRGEISSFGSSKPGTLGLVVSKKPQPDISDNSQHLTIPVPENTGEFRIDLQGVSDGTPYYLRLFTINKATSESAGATYSNDFTYQSDKIQLTVETPPVVDTKIFDGSTTAQLKAEGVLTGIKPTDLEGVIITAVASYSDYNPGTDKTLTISYVLSGPNASLYKAPASIVIQNAVINRSMNLRVSLEGVYNYTNSLLNKCREWDEKKGDFVDKFEEDIVDTLSVELHHSKYNEIEYALNGLVLHQDGSITTRGFSSICVPPVVSGSYHITIKSRNHLETTTSDLVTFNSNHVNYDFTDSYLKAWSSDVDIKPTKKIGTKWTLYAGDVVSDTAYPEINLTDLYDLFNNKSAINNSFGYQKYDLNGDGEVDDSDLYILFSNQSALLYIE